MTLIQPAKRHRPRGGFTLLEVLIVTAILGVLTAGIVSFQITSFTVATEQSALQALQTRGRSALETISLELGRALSVGGGDNNFQLLYVEDTGNGRLGRGITFRRVVSADLNGPIFGPVISFAGPWDGDYAQDLDGGSNITTTPTTNPSGPQIDGVVRLVGNETLLYPGGSPLTFTPLASSTGADGIFGTRDDPASQVFSQSVLTPDGNLDVRDTGAQLLIESAYAPRPVSGSRPPMLQVFYDPSADEYAITVTLTLNIQRSTDGSQWLLGNNLTLSERVTLRQ